MFVLSYVNIGGIVPLSQNKANERFQDKSESSLLDVGRFAFPHPLCNFFFPWKLILLIELGDSLADYGPLQMFF